MWRKQPDKPLDLHGHMMKLKERFEDLANNRICPVCEAPISDSSHRYCILCGVKLPKTGRVPKMLYKSIRLSENGKAVICPHCDNEEMTTGDFCMICGCNIVNRCADTPGKARPGDVSKSCHAILSGNARYCPKCGNESTFYQKGWLKDWRSENTKRAIENINMAVDITEIAKERKPG